MGPDVKRQWQRVGELFEQALALPAADRETFLSALGDDDDVKREVRSLLSAHEQAEGFLESRADLSMRSGEVSRAVVSPAADLAPGTQVGPYRIAGVLGRGGMGVVYEATDVRLQRRVALKALPSAAATDERHRQRLRQEARAAAALQHPHIAIVYSLDEIDGHVFIASELLEGSTLRAELESRGSLGAAAATRAGVQLAQALVAAHERGIVHRDLKPENVFRTREGILKVLDFGLAQLDDEARTLMTVSRLTAPGLLLGTPAYMAPEQLLGHATDFHVDHFALGVILYELATGRHPFGAQSLPSTIARILAADPTPPDPPRELPALLWNVIERCLRKNPAHRFTTTRELLAALEAAAVASPFASSGEIPFHVRSPALSPPGAAGAGMLEAAALGSRARRGTAEGHVLRWWRFHQMATAAAYAAMVWPAWHVHRSLAPAGVLFFLAVLASIVIASTLRLHLWFSSRVYPEHLPAQRARAARWIRAADIAFAALLIVGGVALPPEQAGWAALFISVGAGAAAAFSVIEPATTRAAFRRGGGA